MKEIPLTQSKVALIDDEDYPLISQFNWHTKKDNNNLYAISHTPNNHAKVLYMHRLIMKTPNGLEVDHKDHNGLNCQKSNMRNCTHHQNTMNLKSNRGASEYKGVYKHGKKFQANLRLSGQRFHLGTFDTETAAAIAYDKKALELFGEFANLNFK